MEIEIDWHWTDQIIATEGVERCQVILFRNWEWFCETADLNTFGRTHIARAYPDDVPFPRRNRTAERDNDGER